MSASVEKPVRASIVLELPRPLSVNLMFRNVMRSDGKPGGRIKTAEYTAWIEAANKKLRGQRPGHISGQVEVSIIVAEGRYDLDNCCKAILDCIVFHGIIDGDNYKVLRKLTVEFGEVEGARIEIRPWWTPRKIALRGAA